jgi:Diacylglycerol kinase catalytic domain
MSRIGVISNVRSQRNRREMLAMHAVLGRHPGVLHRELEDMAELPGILAGFADRELDLLVVNGGDGTVQAVMTELINRRPFRVQPRLAPLHAGMTNLAAHRLGWAGRPSVAVERLLRRAAAGARLPGRRQSVLSLRRTPDEPPVHGLFLGTAAFYRGTMMGRARVHRLGVERSTQAGLSVALYVLRALFHRGPDDAWVRGDAIGIDWEEGSEPARPRFLLLATTLDRLMLGLRPFWGEGEAAIRWTVADHPPRRLGRALLPMMRGRPRRWMAEAGYRSRRSRRVTLALDCPIMFDGETFTPEPGCPVVLWHEHELEFVAG